MQCYINIISYLTSFKLKLFVKWILNYLKYISIKWIVRHRWFQIMKHIFKNAYTFLYTTYDNPLLFINIVIAFGVYQFKSWILLYIIVYICIIFRFEFYINSYIFNICLYLWIIMIMTSNTWVLNACMFIYIYLLDISRCITHIIISDAIRKWIYITSSILILRQHIIILSSQFENLLNQFVHTFYGYVNSKVSNV